MMARNGTASWTILVVDDVEDGRSLLRHALEMSGHRVLEASDGEEAVNIARKSCPDLILMDLNLPKLDGLMATKRIRDCKELFKDIPIVAITAYNTYGMKKAALEAGCNGYIAKPIDFDRLDQVLRRFLRE